MPAHDKPTVPRARSRRVSRPPQDRSAASFWIRHLGLQPHPEGGYFRETYRAAEQIPARGLPARFGGPRAFATAIHFLLRSGDFSAFHRLHSDEIWHFYAGAGLTLYIIDRRGRLTAPLLGRNAAHGEHPQIVLPARCWFAARVARPRTYTLVGCTVAPGFDFHDFEIADRDGLIRQFPRHRRVIRELTREPLPHPRT